MELPILLVADYANTTSDGKLNVMGIFQSINVANFPATHPEMYVIAQFAAGPAEYGRKFQLGIKLLNEDATQALVDFSADAEVPRGNAGQQVHMNSILRLVNTNFAAPGTYEVSVLVDQDQKGSLAIQVNQMPTPTI